MYDGKGKMLSHHSLLALAISTFLASLCTWRKVSSRARSNTSFKQSNDSRGLETQLPCLAYVHASGGIRLVSTSANQKRIHGTGAGVIGSWLELIVGTIASQDINVIDVFLITTFELFKRKIIPHHCLGRCYNGIAIWGSRARGHCESRTRKTRAFSRGFLGARFQHSSECTLSFAIDAISTFALWQGKISVSKAFFQSPKKKK